MRICLEGAFCTGKTTIGKLVAEQLKVPFIDEVARQAVEIGYKLDKSANFETQFWILAKQFEEEMTANYHKGGFVGDRGVLSVAVYTFLNKNISAQRKAFLYKIIKEELLGSGRTERRYDLVIYFPIGRLKMDDDGVRSVDPDFQKELDRIFLLLLKNWNIPYYEVTSLPIEDRVQEILEVIQKHNEV